MPGKRLAGASSNASQRSASGGAQKKPKLVVGVMDAISAAENISQECRQMLVAGCPGSLGEYADSRHEHQELVVSLIGQVLEESKKSLEAKLAEREANVSQFDANQTKLAAACEEATEALQTMKQQAKQSETDLGKATSATEAARRLLRDKQAAVELLATKSTRERGRLEEVFLHLRAAQAGQADAKHSHALADMATELGLDESLCMVLPKTCAKSPDERGEFDNLVLSELEKTLQERIFNVAEDGVAEKTADAQRKQAVADASVAAEKAATAQAETVAELAAAHEAYDQQIVVHADALEVEFAAWPQAKNLAARNAANEELEAFLNCPWESFVLLKHRSVNKSKD